MQSATILPAPETLWLLLGEGQEQTQWCACKEGGCDRHQRGPGPLWAPVSWNGSFSRSLVVGRRLLLVVASLAVAPGLSRAGSVVVAHGLSCSAACGIFLDQGLNPRSPVLAGRFFSTGPPGESSSLSTFLSQWSPLGTFLFTTLEPLWPLHLSESQAASSQGLPTLAPFLLSWAGSVLLTLHIPGGR